MHVQDMDLKSAWALGEFRDAPLELRLLEHSRNTGPAAVAHGGAARDDSGIPHPQQQQHSRPMGTDAYAAAAAAGGRRRSLSIRSAYQGERLSGLLVVKFDAGDGERLICVVLLCT